MSNQDKDQEGKGQGEPLPSVGGADAPSGAVSEIAEPFGMPLTTKTPGPNHTYIRDRHGETVATCWGPDPRGFAEYAVTAIHAHKTLLDAVTDACCALAAWMVPDSGISNSQALDRLLEILDDRKVAALVKDRISARLARAERSA